ncbi:MAG: hypothetical protein PF495_01515 [Spirochaetales bacterium]|jgi:hypothetical protein|nr:hypothetical protein [Spirochaetales bacterium]
MKTSKSMKQVSLMLGFTALMCTASPLAAQVQSGGDLMPNIAAPDRITVQNYANLSELITLVCDDAMESFWEFYGPTTVTVHPFTVIADYRVKKSTMLGITFADQMVAMINIQAVPEHPTSVRHPQKLEGVIEEMDGFLRIHINGRNVRGERRSYSVNVEMSEPIYRALHAYAESY